MISKLLFVNNMEVGSPPDICLEKLRKTKENAVTIDDIKADI
jgi:hypothetical protein